MEPGTMGRKVQFAVENRIFSFRPRWQVNAAAAAAATEAAA